MTKNLGDDRNNIDWRKYQLLIAASITKTTKCCRGFPGVKNDANLSADFLSSKKQKIWKWTILESRLAFVLKIFILVNKFNP